MQLATFLFVNNYIVSYICHNVTNKIHNATESGALKSKNKMQVVRKNKDGIDIVRVVLDVPVHEYEIMRDHWKVEAPTINRQSFLYSWLWKPAIKTLKRKNSTKV